MTEFDSLIGIFESGASDTSQNARQIVSDAINDKYSYLFDEYSDNDLQHDLALLTLDFPGDLDIVLYRQELKRRNAPVPQNPRWVYDPYARFGKRLTYDL